MGDTAKWHRYLRFWRADVAADVDAELTFHVDARTEELCEAGLDRAAARARALREFGDVERTRRTLRAMDERHAAGMRRAGWLADLARDGRVALRALARSPGLVAVVALTFALGIGVTSAMYSVVDAFLFRPLPGAHGRDLVVLARTEAGLPMPHDLSFPDYRDYRADSAVFGSLAAFASRFVELETARGADRLFIDDATANYFAALGLPPMLGRTFAPGDDQGVLAHPAIVLTYKAWRAHFAGDSSVVGRTIRINEHPVTVIGVMPPSFHGVRPLVDVDGVACLDQIWPAYGPALENRASIMVSAFGRLRPGVSLSSARAAVRLRARQLARAYPTTNKTVDAVLVPERHARPSAAVASVTPAAAGVFMALVTLVLLVACANVAGLLLARVIARGRELAIRAALGASQWRLVRLALVECALLAALGGIGAVGVADAALHAIDAIHVATDMPIRWGVGLDGRVVAFTAAATLLAALVAGAAPAATARRRDLADVLKSGARGTTATRRRLRSALVVGQIAVSVVVLACAGLFARSSAHAARLDLGFRADHVLLLSTTLRAQTYDSARGRALYRELLRRAAAVPGARETALARYLPFGFERDNVAVVPLASATPVPTNGVSYFDNVVSGDYFAAMGIPLRRGRTFTDRDDATAPRVAIVNDAFARTFWPGRSALGERFRVGGAGGRVVEIVGVVGDMQDLVVGETPRPYVFLPLGQIYQGDMTLVVHTARDPATLAAPLRAVVASLDPALPVFDVRTMHEHLHDGQALLLTRLGSGFASVFGALALALATVGVYGVVSYAVAQRTREIGVLVALGARVPTILRLVVGEGLTLAWLGVGAGLVLALATTGVVGSILVGVAPRDPLVLGAAAALLVAVAAAASLVPARRAARVDPITALRAE